MSLTYTQLKTAIQDHAQNSGTAFVAANDIFIRHAENTIYRRVSLTVGRKNSLGATTSAQKYLSVPSDFLTPDSLAIVVSGSHVYLLLKDRDFIREAYPSATTTGQPKYYSIFDDSAFLLGPTPDAAYVAELHYFHIPTTIVTAATTWLGDNAEECLLRGCMVEATAYLKGPEDMLGYWKQQFEESIAMLKNEHESKAQTDEYSYGSLRKPPV